MGIRVDNLNNLFWDNGGYRFPNTYPHLIGGEWLEKVTPVMTTPVTGWVVLTGEYNYAEYNGELFFLKKDKQISYKKNKWRYILIKDHLCTLFKNKANVIAKGTLINASLDKLQDSDFEFTLPIFTNFNHRILLPLNKQIYNWKKHIVPNAPFKVFDGRYAIDNKDYARFLRQLENNKALLNGKKFEKAKDFTLLGRAKLSKKNHNWKNELVVKIRELLSNLDNDDVILAQFGTDYGSGNFLRNKYVITHDSYSLGARKEEFKQVLNLDLSGLEDIELISLTTGKPNDKATYFRVELTEEAFLEDRENIVETYIKKLARRNRVSFLNPYSTRAIYERSGKLNTWFNVKDGGEFYFPQKVFFKTTPSLLAKSQYQRHFPLKRKIESFRSVYLYSVRNLNFVYQFKSSVEPVNDTYREINFIDPDTYFSADESNKAISKNLLKSTNGFNVVKPPYDNLYAWNVIGEPLNIGWLIGQFSLWLNNQDTYFEVDKPFIVKRKFDSLRRIKGLNKLISRLVQNEDAYEPTAIREEKNFHFTLDIFGKLSARARQATQEADFLIGEKLLFTTWGLPTYLLFQPIKDDGYDYTIDAIDKSSTLIGRWLTGASWFYGYSVFDEGRYVSEWAKAWMKMGYSNFNELSYDRYYSSPSKYQQLKTHIKRNTNAYFISETVPFKKTPIRECNVGDIFFSDLDYFFFSHDEGNDLTQTNFDWFTHIKDRDSDLQDKEIVVYHDIQDGGLAIGKVNVFETETTLPDGQFIAEGSAISGDSSNVNKVRSKLTKISKISKYENFDEVINVVRNRPSEFFQGGIIDFTLDDLKGNPYLFDLKGTDFYCLLDAQGRVNLIFKESEKDVKVSQKQIYAIAANEAIAKLDKTQWVNQKVNLSIYGQKIELPVKAFAQKILITIELDTANLERIGQQALDSHKIEISHALGKTYLRFDTSKLETRGTAQFNVFDIERLDIANMRASEDYLVKRREFDLNTQSMNLEHRRMRFENEMQKVSLITNTIMGAIGGITSIAGIGLGIATGLSKMAKLAGTAVNRLGTGMTISAVNQGVGTISSGVSSYLQLRRHSENTAMMNEKIGQQIEKHALNSYTIDLSYARQKEDYAFNLRRAFAQQTYNQTSSRERNLALDDKEKDLEGVGRKEDKEIYLEIWTISDKQKEYVSEYHKEFGVDCRVANSLIPVGNGMKTGVYKMESVELTNLNDRIDLLLIKALLENGIQIVEWIEHEQVKELIPEDPRIAKLQKQIKDLEALRRQLEQEKESLNVRIQQLTVEISNSKDEEFRLQGEIKDREKKIEKIKEDLNVASQQLEYEVDKYDKLSVGYRKLEEDKAVEERLKNLYLDEKNKLTEELRVEKQSLKNLQFQKKDIENNLKQKEKELEEANTSKEELQKSLSALNIQLNSEKQKNTELTEDLKKQLEECKQRERVLFTEKSKSNEEIENLKKENLDLENKVKECAQLEEKISKLEEIEAELTKVKEEKDTLTKQYDAKLIEIQEKDKTIEGLRLVEKFEAGNAPNKYCFSLLNNMMRVLNDYNVGVTAIFPESKKSGTFLEHVGQYGYWPIVWSSKYKIFVKKEQSYMTISMKKLWWGSSQLGFFWKFNRDDFRNDKLRAIWQYGTDDRNYLSSFNSHADSYDNAVYVGQWNVIMTSYFDYVASLNFTESELDTYSNDAVLFQTLHNIIYFHPEKGWTNEKQKSIHFHGVNEDEIISIVTYGDWLKFMGCTWDAVKHKVVPK